MTTAFVLPVGELRLAQWIGGPAANATAGGGIRAVTTSYL
jgi:hypothetical protein